MAQDTGSGRFKGQPTPLEAIVVAYYLARFDTVAINRLGFKNQSECFNQLAELLKVPRNTLKNRRDDFDPLFEHRAGWHQYDLGGKLARVAETFEDTDDEDLHQMIDGILEGKGFLKEDAWEEIKASVENSGKKKAKFVPRGITGRKAEEAFEKHHEDTGEPFEGVLKDRRDDGCGYDYDLSAEHDNYLIEVKGLHGLEGGISFTAKEWEMAQKHGEKYFVVVVRNVEETPEFQFINDPTSKLDPTQQIIRTVQIRWGVSQSQLVSSKELEQ
jgi:hypothetical protein